MFAFFKRILNKPDIDFNMLIAQGALIADVRSPGEFQAGHIKGSKNYPLDSLTTKIPELKKINKPVITVCRSGARSGVAKNLLQAAGIEVYNGGPWTSLQIK